MQLKSKCRGTGLLFLVLLILSCKSKYVSNNNGEADKIAAEIEFSLKNELLDTWYPASVDSVYGGFLSSFSHDFKPEGIQDKMIVTQARHTWVTAKASEKYPNESHFINCAAHGFRFLRDVLWDKQYGGFHTLVNREGKVKSRAEEEKTAYGNAFAIYALSAYHQASGDEEALELAKKTFLWLEKYSHDSVYKGYYQHMYRNGSHFIRDTSVPLSAEFGYKDQNSTIHLLEAFTELYRIWPDKLLRERLEELFYLIRDRIVTPNGYMLLFFTPDWTPVSFRDSSRNFIKEASYIDHVSFGHDVEVAYLLLETAKALGYKDDQATLSVAKKLTDHALNNGWDDESGGFYDEGYYFKGEDLLTVTKDTKNWWAQAEGLNTLLLMSKLFHNDKTDYYGKFVKQWNYIKIYLIDHEHGDWFPGGLDKDPESKTAMKGSIWKGCYHQYRALANCIEMLEEN
jgi:cellobiose epimerase